MLLMLSFSSGDKMADKENFSSNPDNSDLETSGSGGNHLPVDKTRLNVTFYSSFLIIPEHLRTSSQPVSALVQCLHIEQCCSANELVDTFL